MLAFLNCDGDLIGDRGGANPYWHFGKGVFPEMPAHAEGFYGSRGELHLLIGDLDKAVLEDFKYQMGYVPTLNEEFTLELMSDNMSFLYPLIKDRAERANAMWMQMVLAKGIDPGTGHKVEIQPDWNS